jgi:peptidoglycan hydrolase-like protein with peptidoglycan-binding domain
MRVRLLVVVLLSCSLAGCGNSTDSPAGDATDERSGSSVEVTPSDEVVPTDDESMRPEVQRGDEGQWVMILQQELIRHGYVIEEDGTFRSMTEAAVRDFQAVHDLVVDGIVGPNTWAALAGTATSTAAASSTSPPGSTPAGTAPSELVLRSDGLGSFAFGDLAEGLVADLVATFGPPSDEVVFSAQPPDRLHMPGGYQALHDLVQYEWSDPAFLVILSDMPFLGDRWGEPVPGTLHLIAWETSGRLPLDTGVTVGSNLVQLRNAYRDVIVGNYGNCESDYDPAAFTAPAKFALRGTLDWNWVTDLQIALNERGATIDVDGTYGPATAAAVQRFQQAQDISADNALVGPATINALALTAPDNTHITGLFAGYPGSC